MAHDTRRTSLFAFAAAMVFFYAPLLVLVLFSFNESKTMTWSGFSLRWYGDLLFHSRDLWHAVGNSAIIALSGHTSVVNNGYIYVLGGSSSTASWLNDVQYAPINADGTLGSWQNTTSFNTPRVGHTSVVNNGYLYVIGGNVNDGNGNGVGTTDVQYAHINGDGSVGNWQSTTPFNSPGRWAFASAVSNGYLYVIQGFTHSAAAPCTDVQFAKFNADGSLGAWQSTSTFSPARWTHSSAAWDGHIYSMGGLNWNGSYYALSDVQFSTSNSDGTLAPWQTTTQMTSPLGGMALVASNNYLFLTGGSTPTPFAVLDSVMYVAINSDGSLGTWQSTTPFSTARESHTSVVNNGYLYILGGAATTGLLNDVQFVKIN